MADFNETDGFHIYGWMTSRMQLSGGELLTYALVRQFSQGRAGIYTGGVPYLVKFLNCSDGSARNYLHKLVGKGLIREIDATTNGVPFKHYQATPQNLQGTPQNLQGDPSKFGGSTPQNLQGEENNKNRNKTEEGSLSGAPARGKFDFRHALLDLGVTAETADAWMEVRRRAKAVNSELAFKDVAAQIAKSGHTAEECIHRAAAKSWRGFEAAWMEDRQPAQQRQQPRKQENYFEANARVAEQIRRDLFKEAQPYDEQ